MTPKRKSRKRRLMERQAIALRSAIAEHVSAIPTERHIAQVAIRSPLHKPQVGYQGTYRKPKEVPDGADAPAFYKRGGRMAPQKSAPAPRVKVNPVPGPSKDGGTLGRRIPLPLDHPDCKD